MPANLVKSPADEKHWKEAKATVRKQYPDIEEGSERFYRLVTSIFEKMSGRTTKALRVDGSGRLSVIRRRVAYLVAPKKAQPVA